MLAHLAQVNIARLRAPADSPIVAEFIEALDEINALAESSAGFVWRLKTDAGNALSVRAYEDPLVQVNLSVWESPESLKAYVYGSMHGKFYARRAAWFEKMEKPHLALWWIPAGTLPTVEEAKQRLAHRDIHGDTAFAFSFRKMFPPDAVVVAS